MKVAVISLFLIAFFTTSNARTIEPADSLFFGMFGKLTIYKPTADIRNVVICISGDGGWDKSIKNIAFQIKSANTLLIGVDIRKYLHNLNNEKSSCLYPAADFESMSEFVQKKLRYETYHIPVLLGYSSGAALVYGILAQAPQNTFQGGIVLGFCPDLRIKKPLCAGSGKFVCTKRRDNRGYDLGPNSTMNSPLISLQGNLDEICNYKATVEFLKALPKAEVITLQKVGHGYGVEKYWVPQMLQAFNRLTLNYTQEHIENEMMKTDLPVHLTPALRPTSGNTMVLMISGDGGWTGFDQQVANEFAKKGLPVVGLNALKYFWQQKNPVKTTLDAERLILQYATLWKKDKIILLGYSFGADIIPFIFNRLPENSRKDIHAVILLSPSPDTDFEIHVTDLLNFSSDKRAFNVPEEIKKIKGTPVVCFFGNEEDGTHAVTLADQHIEVVILNGGHHYDNSFSEIVKRAIYP
ncbi:MAG: AcvB/VirJ family lysyl-phosphatidylglycerol hydrolase [Sphingobacteriaceae bacterium]